MENNVYFKGLIIGTTNDSAVLNILFSDCYQTCML